MTTKVQDRMPCTYTQCIWVMQERQKEVQCKQHGKVNSHKLFIHGKPFKVKNQCSEHNQRNWNCTLFDVIKGNDVGFFPTSKRIHLLCKEETPAHPKRKFQIIQKLKRVTSYWWTRCFFLAYTQQTQSWSHSPERISRMRCKAVFTQVRNRHFTFSMLAQNYTGIEEDRGTDR